jgi:hypothetical protein
MGRFRAVEHPPVRVVAIGGGASVGKTTCSLAVARLLELPIVVHVDDLSNQLGDAGDVHFLDQATDPWDQPADLLTEQLIVWTARLHPPILDAVRGLSATGGVIEGEGIDPRLTGRWPEGVGVVYVIEHDRDVLWENFAFRQSAAKFRALGIKEQAAVVDMNVRYGQWLKQAAEQAGEQWVPSRPWETLAERCMGVLT